MRYWVNIFTSLWTGLWSSGELGRGKSETPPPPLSPAFPSLFLLFFSPNREPDHSYIFTKAQIWRWNFVRKWLSRIRKIIVYSFTYFWWRGKRKFPKLEGINYLSRLFYFAHYKIYSFPGVFNFSTVSFHHRIYFELTNVACYSVRLINSMDRAWIFFRSSFNRLGSSFNCKDHVHFHIVGNC